MDTQGRLLEGRVAVVVGADHPDNIGYGIAKGFAEHGADVVIVGLDEARLPGLARSLSPRSFGRRVDVTDRAEVEALMAEIGATFGRVDVVVYNVGIAQNKPLEAVTDEDFATIIDVNVGGALRVVQAASPWLHEGAAIITIGSLSAQRGGGYRAGPHYTASKAALWGMTKSLARILGPRGIRANIIHPAHIHTPMTAAQPELTRESNIADTPLGRLGTPRDVAGAAVFLASDLSAFVTGQALAVNGGIHID